MNSKRTKMISVRASEEEIVKVKALVRKLKTAHRYLKEADVLRELIGLENTGLITSEMRSQLSASEPGHEWSIVSVKRLDSVSEEDKKKA